jgi:hypothetical protein
MLRDAVNRLVPMIPTLLGVAVLTSFMLRVVPGDIVEVKLRGKPAGRLMPSDNASGFYREAPWLILFPGFAISLAVFAFSLFGDSLRDWLHPKFKS